jgi:hypothetical protein
MSRGPNMRPEVIPAAYPVSARSLTPTDPPAINIVFRPVTPSGPVLEPPKPMSRGSNIRPEVIPASYPVYARSSASTEPPAVNVVSRPVTLSESVLKPPERTLRGSNTCPVFPPITPRMALIPDLDNQGIHTRNRRQRDLSSSLDSDPMGAIISITLLPSPATSLLTLPPIHISLASKGHR